MTSGFALVIVLSVISVSTMYTELSIVVYSIFYIGSIIIIIIGSYFIKRHVINNVLKVNLNLLNTGYSVNSFQINKQIESKIYLPATLASLYSLYIIWDPYSYIHNITNFYFVNTDIIAWYKGIIIYIIIIFGSTILIKKIINSSIVKDIQQKIKLTSLRKQNNNRLKPLYRSKYKTRNSKIDAMQYGITTNMSKKEKEKKLRRVYQKWHNAENSPDSVMKTKAIQHKKNIGTLMSELNNNL